MDKTRTIYVVDDDSAVCGSLRTLLETYQYSVTCFRNGADFLSAVEALPLGCVLLDVRLPDTDGLSVQRRLKEMQVTLPVVMMTGYADVALAVASMRLHAVDFLEKPINIDRLLEAIERALSFAEKQQDAIAREEIARLMLNDLTPRETQVYLQLILGQANKSVGRVLGLSPRTIEVHRKHIYEKLSANGLADLVRIAIAAGIEMPAN